MSEWVWCGLSSEPPAAAAAAGVSQAAAARAASSSSGQLALRAGPSVVAALAGPWLVVRERRERRQQRHSNAAPGPGEEGLSPSPH